MRVGRRTQRHLAVRVDVQQQSHGGARSRLGRSPIQYQRMGRDGGLCRAALRRQRDKCPIVCNAKAVVAPREALDDTWQQPSAVESFVRGPAHFFLYM